MNKVVTGLESKSVTAHEVSNTIEILTDYESICEDVKKQDALISDWKNYVTAERYAARLTFNEVVQNSIEVGDFLKSIK